MKREAIHTDRAPRAIGTYSQAVRAGESVYISGQIPLDPETMELVKGDIAAEIHQVFRNLAAVATAVGVTLSTVVKLNIYLTDLTHFGMVNEIMPQYFPPPFPARAAVGVADLPRGARIEADAILVLGQQE